MSAWPGLKPISAYAPRRSVEQVVTEAALQAGGPAPAETISEMAEELASIKDQFESNRQICEDSAKRYLELRAELLAKIAADEKRIAAVLAELTTIKGSLTSPAPAAQETKTTADVAAGQTDGTNAN